MCGPPLAAHSHHSQASAERVVRHRHARREEHAHVTAQDASMARSCPTITALGIGAKRVSVCCEGTQEVVSLSS